MRIHIYVYIQREREMYIYIYIYVHTYIYIYIYRPPGARGRSGPRSASLADAAAAHAALVQYNDIM